MRLGIDASNIRDGGGLGHISEILQAAQPQEFGISKIVVWGGKTSLAAMLRLALLSRPATFTTAAATGGQAANSCVSKKRRAETT